MKQLTIIGNLGRDAEIKEWDGKRYTSFSIAYSERFKKDGVTTEKTEWYSIISPREQLAQYLKSGSKVLVQGKPTEKMYQKKDGSWAIDRTIRATSIEFLSSPKAEANVNASAPAFAPQEVPPALQPEGEDEELPF